MYSLSSKFRKIYTPKTFFLPRTQIFALFILSFLLLSTLIAYAKITQNNITYYSHNEIASKLKLKSHWNHQSEEVILTGPNTRISFLNKKRYAIINDIQIWLGHPTLLNKNELYIAESDFAKTIGPIITPQNYSMPPKLAHIVIDPGHGGNDEGARNATYKVKEKNLALDLSHQLQTALKNAGYKVTLTRNGDKYLPLKSRPEIANNQHADLFVSIHFNSVENAKESVQGIETYALSLENHPSTAEPTHSSAADKESLPGNKNDTWNSLLGYKIQSHLINTLNAKDRGLRRSRFAVLKALNCPGILIEAGFLSNSEECQKLKSLAYRQKIIEAIVDGIKDYHQTIRLLKT